MDLRRLVLILDLRAHMGKDIESKARRLGRVRRRQDRGVQIAGAERDQTVRGLSARDQRDRVARNIPLSQPRITASSFEPPKLTMPIFFPARSAGRRICFYATRLKGNLFSAAATMTTSRRLEA
jgi:hypothetical protein